jgi:hypothetical protein
MKAAERVMDQEVFAEIVTANRWQSVPELVEQLDTAGFWADDFLSEAELQSKKSWVRRHIKQLKDSSDFPLWASVKTKDDDGRTVTLYKQETFFDVEDYRQVVNYHAGRSDHHREMARGYSRRCKERLGKQIRLPFGD